MKIAINGFGRIGRLLLRQMINQPQIEVVAINDLGSLANLAYLFRYDSVYRMYQGSVQVNEASQELIIDGKKIKFLSQKDPLQLPWKDLQIDAVVESTGVFESFEKASVHLQAGAKRVLLTAPAKDSDSDSGKTILMGINGQQISTCSITSNASCTTNGASPVMAVLDEVIGIEKAVLSTTHAYTATQNIVDGPVKGDDFRRGRAGAQNIVPSTTGAAKALTRALPSLEGKFDGVAIRVPVVSGSLVDITFIAKRSTTVEEINAALQKASVDKRWEGLLGYTQEQIVSGDVVGMQLASLVDGRLTKVIDGNLVKVCAWYDNEWGYVTTLVKHLQEIEKVAGN